jgi:hypothetical protein
MRGGFARFLTGFLIWAGFFREPESGRDAAKGAASAHRPHDTKKAGVNAGLLQVAAAPGQ